MTSKPLIDAFAPLMGEERTGDADGSDAARSETWSPIVPAPDDCELPARFAPPSNRGRGWWVYCNTKGQIAFLVTRREVPGGKVIRPLTYGVLNGQLGWHMKWPLAARPLYNLPELRAHPDAPVLVVEGEKTAGAAGKRFGTHVAVTSSGGNSAVSCSDWSPLKGRHVVIWPDRDPPGERYADDVARRLLDIGAASTRIVKVPSDWPEGWDLADPAPEGVGAKDLQAILLAAEPPPRQDLGDGGAIPDMSLLRDGRREPPALPLEVFGDFWSTWIDSAAECAGAPLDYVAAAVLAAGAALVGNTRRVVPWDGWQEPLVLWCGLVGDPSTAKSPAMDPMLDLLRQREAEMAAGFESTLRQHHTAKAATRAVRERWEDEVQTAVNKGLPPPEMPLSAVEPETPERPRVLANDATVEKLARLLAGLPRGLFCIRDEITGWLGNFDRYGGAGGDRAFWIEAYGGRPYTVDRVKDARPIRIPYLGISILGGIQPDRLADSVLYQADDGLAARFLFFWPDPRPPVRPSGRLDREPALRALVRLQALEFAGVHTAQADLRPIDMKLDDQASDLFHAWRVEHHEMALGTGGLFGSYCGKCPGHVLRLAGVLRLLWWAAEGRGTPPDSIGQDAIAAACTLVTDYLIPMARRVYGDAARPPQERQAATLARWIARERPPTINGRVLQRDVRLPGLTSADEIRAACAELINAGWLLQPEAMPRPGRPRGDYVVNPGLWKHLA